MPAAQNSTSFFLKRKNQNHFTPEIDANGKHRSTYQQASSRYAPSPCALRAKKVRQKRGREDRREAF